MAYAAFNISTAKPIYNIYRVHVTRQQRLTEITERIHVTEEVLKINMEMKRLTN